MIRILKAIWGIYALLIFVITLFIAILCYFVIFTFASKNKAASIAHQYVSRNWARTLLIMFGIRLKIKNKHLLKKDETYVFVANHLSQLDIPADAIATDHVFKYLAKEELNKIPMMGYIIRNLYISVNRKDKFARAKSMENMQKNIRDGISVFIFPEGTRNKTSEPLLDFRDGAFRLAIQAQVPIAALTLLNTGKLLSPMRPIELSPGVITCVWSKPFATNGMTQQDIPALKETVISEMKKILSSQKN